MPSTVLMKWHRSVAAASLITLVYFVYSPQTTEVYFYKILLSLAGWIMLPPPCISPHPNPWTLWLWPYLMKGLCKCDSVKNLEVGNFPWIILGGPLESQWSLWGEGSWNQSRRRWQRSDRGRNGSLKMGEGTTSQGKTAAGGAGKGMEMGSPSRRKQPIWYWFWPVTSRAIRE